jgi:phosphoribosyl-AMP cyclohydrolase / phosphoribosyl-ATP pyrophosphohydrolase
MTELSENFLEDLFQIVRAKKDKNPAESYTAKLYNDISFNAQKVGEEAVEVVVAALSQEKEDLIYETCDLLYHLTVLLERKGVSLADLRSELSKRNHEVLDRQKNGS